MKIDRFKYIEVASGLPFAYDRVVGAEAYVRATNGNTFNLTRQGGFRIGNQANVAANKSGGNATFYRSAPGYPASLYIQLDRGGCPRSTADGVNCSDAQPPEKNSYDNFFVRNSQFPVGALNFTAAGVVIKIDYVCASAGCKSESVQPPTTYTQWKELGTWNMGSIPSKVFSSANFGGAGILNNLVEMNATIHSDPFNDPAFPSTSNTIQIDNLDHLGTKGGGSWEGNVKTPYFRSRGGFMWYGQGCYHWRPSVNGSGQCPDINSPTGHDYLKLYRGPGASTSAGPGSSYATGNYFYTQEIPSITIPYSGTQNRGWIKLRSLADANRNVGPYFMKRKAVSIDYWDPYASPTRTISLSQFGVNQINRITRIETVIHSDRMYQMPQVNYPGYAFTNFHRTATNSGTSIGGDGNDNDYVSGEAGGFTYVDQAQGKVILSLGTALMPGAPNHFRSPNYSHYHITHNSSATVRRGFVSLEYLGAKCGEGSGFTRTAIGFTGNQDDCHGNYGSGSAANHVIQTKGQNIDASNSTDRFFFAQKGFTNSNATYTARVDQIENSAASAKAGLMLRLGTASNSRHLSVMVTPSGGIQLIRRATAGGLASITTVSGVKAPIWVRVRRYLDDYYGSYSQDGVNWTPIGQSMYVSNYTGTYNVGLAVTSGTSSVLNTSGFSAVSF